MTAPRLFEIIPFESLDALPEPDNGPYYTITQNGPMLVDRNMFGKYVTPVKEIPSLPIVAPTLIYDIPKMPSTIIGQAYSFFKAIYEDKKSEAMVDITWSADKGYRLFVPPQKASGGGVQAERNPEHYKGQIVGTIHSHCNFNAFHSGTDTHDADGHDGLHITIGNVMAKVPSIAIMMSKGGNRWDNMKLEDVQDGPIELVEHPKWWEQFVKSAASHNQGKHVSQWKPNKPTVMGGNGAAKDEGKGKGETRALVVVGSARKNNGGKKNSSKSDRGGGTEVYKRYSDLIQTAVEAGTVGVSDTVNGTINKNLMLLTQIEEELDLLVNICYRFGIDFDYDFGVIPTDMRGTEQPFPAFDDDDDIPSHWRYN